MSPSDSFKKMVKDLEKWGPPPPRMPPGLRRAPRTSPIRCENCSSFNYRLGASIRGGGRCSQYRVNVDEDQVCGSFNAEP